MTWDYLPTPAPVGQGSAASEETRTASFTLSSGSMSSDTFTQSCYTAACSMDIMPIAIHHLARNNSVGRHPHSATIAWQGGVCMNYHSRSVAILNECRAGASVWEPLKLYLLSNTVYVQLHGTNTLVKPPICFQSLSVTCYRNNAKRCSGFNLMAGGAVCKLH